MAAAVAAGTAGFLVAFGDVPMHTRPATAGPGWAQARGRASESPLDRLPAADALVHAIAAAIARDVAKAVLASPLDSPAEMRASGRDRTGLGWNLPPVSPRSAAGTVVLPTQEWAPDRLPTRFPDSR